VISAIIVTGSAAALGEHGDHQLPRRRLKISSTDRDLLDFVPRT
jgi:hypothetical protein